MEFSHINIPKFDYPWIVNALKYPNQLIKLDRNPLVVLTPIENSPGGTCSIS